MEPPWGGGTKVYINDPGHMTKMAAIFTKLGMKHRGLLPIIVYINDDPGVTLTYFTARSNLET